MWFMKMRLLRLALVCIGFVVCRPIFSVQPQPTNPPAGMALIPAGKFTMGDTFSEGNTNERPTHIVDSGAFYMDKYEVTKTLWDSVISWATTNGYGFDNPGLGKASNHPVHNIIWYDAVKWCNARSEKEGRMPAYYTSAAQITVYRTGRFNVQNDWVKWNMGYRLPTESEWEKAARGGLSGKRFPWGNTITHSLANYFDEDFHPKYKDKAPPYTSPVGSFAANGYDLYDMTGNVWEWCWDCYGAYGSTAQTDPRGPASGPYRVLRGGSWDIFASSGRAAFRGGMPPTFKSGFRSVLPIGQ
jgi:formylglycine-generating enzyme